MHLATPLDAEATEADDDHGQAYSYAEWAGGLSHGARAWLAEARQRRQPRPAAGPGHDQDDPGALAEILRLLGEVRDLLVSQRVVREYYSTEQAAQILGKSNWTVREWCRLGRVNAEKRQSGRGRARDWVISHAELQRIERDGLLPPAKH